jgi:uncharacterized membrane protein YfhO
MGTHRTTLEVESLTSSLVVIAQSLYTPWRAQINGAPARIWRANHAFQAIVVPPGRSVISLKYEDHAFMAGLAVSVLALAIAWRARADRAGPAREKVA